MKRLSRQFFQEEGRKGGLTGGNIRAARLSPERRKQIATKAAKARWAKVKAAKGDTA